MSKVFIVIFLSFFSLAFSKVYDCFMYFNEADVLEVRLNELYDYVDYFVLVESSEAHRKGQIKPFYFEENIERFEKFLDKIIYVKLDEHIDSDDGWVRENWQRNQIMRGLVNCNAEDLILISDVDEFIPGRIISEIYKKSNKHQLIGFFHEMYRWKLNGSAQTKWAGTAAIQYKHLLSMYPQEVRNKIRSGNAIMIHAGWHFSSLVRTYEQAREKYYNIVEGYDNFMPKQVWLDQLSNIKFVHVDNSFPKFIVENMLYFTKLGLVEMPR